MYFEGSRGHLYEVPSSMFQVAGWGLGTWNLGHGTITKV
jgi:hypothetical protein